MHTVLDPQKVQTVARVAKLFVDTDFKQADQLIAQQMVNEGIRKVHDNAKLLQSDGTPVGSGKFCGHAFWSFEALAKLRDNGGRVKGITDRRSVNPVIHEHVIPVSFLIERILFANPCHTELKRYEDQILEFSIVAIITDREHTQLVDKKLGRTMPPGWEVGHSRWARYIDAGLINKISSDWSLDFSCCK